MMSLKSKRELLEVVRPRYLKAKKVAPERYMAPRKVAHKVGNCHGMAVAE